MRIDAHQHFWNYDPIRHDWINEDMKAIQKDFLPNDLAPLLQKNDVDGSVLVQVDETDDETEYLVSLAKTHSLIKGVVGWVNLKSDQLEAKLDQYQGSKSLKGFRDILQAKPKGFMTDSKFVDGIRTLGKKGFTYDILSFESQLEEVLELINQLDEQPLVIDHISKPDIKHNSFDHWAKYMGEISTREHVFVKFSGMVTEADWNNWTTNDFHPYIDFCLEKFGPNRLMFGSDWPVCLVAGDYSEVLNIVRNSIDSLSESERNMILGETATRFYKIN